ncbi:MAG: metallophosphoesterase [Oscillospiraceae bacterium]|nr:metallophosphoesterase [Oscillospiraceae bacterium]
MEPKTEQAPKRKRRPSPLLIVLIVCAVLIVPGLISPLTVRRYSIQSPKIASPVRIAVISDLHSCKYGDGQQELLQAIDSQQPDLVMLCGDIFDDERPDDNTEAFLAGISGKYPVYYVTGNHEYWAGAAVFAQKMDILSRYDITRLAGTSETITVGSTTLTIAGVDDPDTEVVDARHGFPEELAEVRPDGQTFTVLLSHRPERFAEYVDSGFDLALCGHAHGGQWRIPGILNGLYAPDQGLFPQYAGGRYEQDGTVMIVSRGLARESTSAPRIYNPPELVIVELGGTQG